MMRCGVHGLDAHWRLEIIDVFDDKDESRATRYYVLENCGRN
ncbi:MAG: hypothetical protein V3U60_16570 [Gammaproteobacteria bacterium]